MIQFKKGYAYHCKTEEQANWILKQAHEQGYKCKTGSSLMNDNFFDEYYEKTCYNIVGGTYCYLNFYKKRGFKIIKVKDLMENKMKYKVGDVIRNSIKERKVLGVCGLAYIVSRNSAFEEANSYLYTQQELDSNNYKLVEPKIKLTLEDVAKLKGVDVSEIEIVD